MRNFKEAKRMKGRREGEKAEREQERGTQGEVSLRSLADKR